VTNNIKRNTKSFEFGDTSIKFDHPIENEDTSNTQQTSFDQSNNSSFTRNKAKKYDKVNKTRISESGRYAE